MLTQWRAGRIVQRSVGPDRGSAGGCLAATAERIRAGRISGTECAPAILPDVGARFDGVVAMHFDRGAKELENIIDVAGIAAETQILKAVLTASRHGRAGGDHS